MVDEFDSKFESNITNFFIYFC